jgi:multiple sugar transport system ATP-binding protein
MEGALMAAVAFDDVSKVFPDGTIAVDRLSLDVEDGEFLVLVGPSGSGKSTALRIVAGLEDATSGDVLIGGNVVTGLEPRRRDIAMIFQNYALYPHMDVRRNLAFGLKLHRVPKPEIGSRVGSTAGMLGIGELLHRRPRQLSGGQRQRVAMGRAIVREPQAFLMDEPLSNLDAKLRVEMRASIARLHQQLRTTTIYVTHDQTEAMTMGDRVAVMKDGRLEQVDTPRELYERPANLFVGAFIGSPALNVVRATVASENGGLVASFGTARLEVPERHPAVARLRRRAGGDVVLGIRPEDIEDAGLTASPEGASFDGDVSLAEPTGADVVAHFEVAGATGPGGEPQPDLVARLNRRSRAASGERLRLVVDVERLYFFDPDTHESLA